MNILKPVALKFNMCLSSRSNKRVCVGWNDENKKQEGLGPVIAYKCFPSQIIQLDIPGEIRDSQPPITHRRRLERADTKR